MRVEIWSDIACPWCYIGKARFEKGLESFKHRADVEVVHRSFELDPGHAKDDVAPVVDMLAAKFGRSRQEALAMEEQVASHARSEGLGYRVGDRDHGNTFDIHRLLHLAKARGRQDELLSVIYRANFAEERSVYHLDTLVDLAVEAGLDEAETRVLLADEDAFADEVRADEREAAELGATGVPFFVLDRRYGVSGGQPAEVFTQALEQAWQGRAVTPLAAAGTANDSAATCDADGGSCEIPGAHSH
ncbi:DsbA family oxidoreductase [Streptomyces sp. NPDC051217]|uniref:DsbA family oxidoreductase n=1 Tax=Streptomyces sp. NPDC051217 TaxID=3365644 RepID=UPI00378C4C3E